MVEADPRIDRLKRMLFLIVLPMILAGQIAQLVVRHPTDPPLPFDLVVTPLGGFYSVALWLLLLARPDWLRLVERLAIVGLTSVLFAKYVYVLTRPVRASELASFLPWMAVGYLGPYVLLDAWWAVFTSFVLLVLTVVVGMAYAIPRFLSGQDGMLLKVLTESFLANGVVVSVMIMYTRLREHYVRTQAVVAAMSEMAHTDFLTGLANRRQLYQMLGQEMEYASRYGHPVSLILLDVDHFKEVNDTFGHDVGDVVLKEFAALIKRNLRGADYFGRWGGEEFLIIATETDLVQAEQLAGRLRQVLQEIRLPRVGHLTASFGVAALTSGDTLESWLKRADEALYRAKQGGRDRVVSATSA